MTKIINLGPFTKDEVVAGLTKKYEAEFDRYEWLGFNCIGGFYEMSSGYYCTFGSRAHCPYCLNYCCTRFGTTEDQRRFDYNEVQAAIDAILTDPEIAAEAEQIRKSVNSLSKKSRKG